VSIIEKKNRGIHLEMVKNNPKFEISYVDEEEMHSLDSVHN